MMKIAICDKIGLCYDGNTLTKQGLGGSESAVILVSKQLQNIGFEVTVFNNCEDGDNSKPGIYDGVRYIDNSQASAHNELYDVVIVSRTAEPFVNLTRYPFIKNAKIKCLWLHDTFCEGDHLVEDLVLSKKIDWIFTLSDFHTDYILNCDHGKKRNYEVLKKHVFHTRNGAVNYIPEVDISKKDKNHFVYNASVTKGMIPLIEDIWPLIKQQIPEAHLTVIGGYYRFRENSEPDAQEKKLKELVSDDRLKSLDINFTDVIPQHKIAEILANANFMIYPGAFPETFGISTLESLLYNTPLITTRFGALEETAVDMACYHVDYAIEPNGLFPHISKQAQINKFVNKVLEAYNNPYLHQQKQNYCSIVKDISGWDTVALQWKQFFYRILGEFLPVEEYRLVKQINEKVKRVFGRTAELPNNIEYSSSYPEKEIVVVSPFRNSQQYLKKCILSVAQQDYFNYKHIIINDNSNDDSMLEVLNTITQLPESQHDRYEIVQNDESVGAVKNQVDWIRKQNDDAIILLLDGDDWLINNNTIFKYYNNLYNEGYEFTYGSCWSLADNIPLIAQDYPKEVKINKTYRNHHFNWILPYTHLRTFKKSLINELDDSNFQDENKNWYKAGGDGSVFYSLIEKANPDKVIALKDVIYVYNDLNPLNDYKINGDEQNLNARKIVNKNSLQSAQIKQEQKNMIDRKKRILIAIPTNKYIEPETFKSIYDLDIPEGYETDFQFFYGYTRSQIKNLICDWAKNYDYTLFVKPNMILRNDTLTSIVIDGSDLISIDNYRAFCVNHNVFLNMVSYPHFVQNDTEITEIETFFDKAKKAGASYGHLTLLANFIVSAKI